MKKVVLVLTVFVFIVAGCEWFIGPTGPAGPEGTAGTDALGTPLIFVPAGNLAEALAFSDHTLISTGYEGHIYTSTNGASWSDAPINADTLYWAAYGNGCFVTASSTQVFYSSDEGALWSEAADYGSFDSHQNHSITGLVFGAGTFVAVGSAGNASPQGFIMRSSYGSAWTDCTPTTASDAFVSVSYTNGQFIAATQTGSVYMSTDGGLSWSSPVVIPQYSDIKKIVYGNGLYLIVGDTSLVSTTDFNDFTTLWEGNASFVSAAFHGGRFTVLCSDYNGFYALWFTDGQKFFWPAGILPPPGDHYSDIQWVPWLRGGTYVISQMGGV